MATRSYSNKIRRGRTALARDPEPETQSDAESTNVLPAADPSQINSVSPIVEEIADVEVAASPDSAAEEAQPTDGGSTVRFMNSEINLSEILEGLLCPSDWVTEAASHPQLANIGEFLTRLSPVAKTTPWVITSMSKDLSGAIRTDSLDHSNGLAVDIAPMYASDELLPEDPPISGLAWNIKSLIVLSEGQWGDMPVFVEGDHLHFSSSIKPDQQGCLPIMWSDSDAYSSMKDQAYDPILSRMRNSFWRWKTPGLELQPPSPQLMQLITEMLHPNQVGEELNS